MQGRRRLVNDFFFPSDSLSSFSGLKKLLPILEDGACMFLKSGDFLSALTLVFLLIVLVLLSLLERLVCLFYFLSSDNSSKINCCFD